MGTHRSYFCSYQKPTRSAGTRQGNHDATSERMCCGKWSTLRTSYVIIKGYPHMNVSGSLGICSLLDPCWWEHFCFIRGGNNQKFVTGFKTPCILKRNTERSRTQCCRRERSIIFRLYPACEPNASWYIFILGLFGSTTFNHKQYRSDLNFQYLRIFFQAFPSSE